MTEVVNHSTTPSHQHDLAEITLTENAVKQMRRSLEKRGYGLGIRLAVKTTGCSGKAYVLEYVDEPSVHDRFKQVDDNWGVYIDPKSYHYLEGAVVDYVRQGINEGFEFQNPNEKGRCGCGESFNV